MRSLKIRSKSAWKIIRIYWELFLIDAALAVFLLVTWGVSIFGSESFAKMLPTAILVSVACAAISGISHYMEFRTGL